MAGPDHDKGKFPRPVRIMAWVSFWADVASEMVYPVIPLYVTGPLKAPAAVLAGMEGAANIVLNFVKGWSGHLSDKLGTRVPFVRIGYAMTAVSKPLTALAFSWPLVALLRIVDRFGKGVRYSPRDALLADAVEPGIAGRAFGFHRAMDAAGAVVGSLTGCVLLWMLPGQYRLVFLGTLLPGIVAVWLTFQLRDKHPAARPEEPETPVVASAVRPQLSPKFYRVLAVSIVFGLANSADMFLLLRAKDLGLSDSLVVLSYVVFNAVYSVSAFPLGHLSDKVGRKTVLAIGWAVYALTYFGFAATPLAGVWPLMALYGIYNGACDGVSRAWVKDASEPENRGTAMGVYAMANGFAVLAGSLVAGVTWDRVDHRAPFWIGGSLATLALIGLLAMWRKV
ncbi:MAG: MFS transporter [Armatimonadetes bacterium]|nr:MFS transporter [Armatimonadota bacterium]